MKRGCQLVLYTALLAAVGVVTSAYAGGKSPQGKPFVAINDQITAVNGEISTMQHQIDSLVGQVADMQDRLTADESAITQVQDLNADLQRLVDNNSTSLTDINNEISSLQTENTTLQADIAANSGDVTSEQSQLNTNAAEIAALQDAILKVNNGMISLQTSLQDQITNNTNLIAAINTEIDMINANLTTKQDLINGTCPDGSAVQQINPDGSVVCGAIGGDTSGQLETTFVWSNSYITGGASTPPGQMASVSVSCPDGYTATSAGVNGAIGWKINMLQTGYRQNAVVQAINENPYATGLTVVATCIRFTP